MTQMRNFSRVARAAHDASDKRYDLDWFIQNTYMGRELTVLKTGEEVRLTGCTNQGFNGIVAHYQTRDGKQRQAPLGAFGIVGR